MSSSSGGGLLSASLMFIPLLAVPFLAAFGLPQFSPVAASSSSAPAAPARPERDPGVGEGRHYTPDDLFLSFDAPNDAPDHRVAASEPASIADASNQNPTWADPFQSAPLEQPTSSPAGPPRSVPNAPPGGAAAPKTITPGPFAEFGQPAPSAGAFEDPAGAGFPFESGQPQASVPPGAPQDEPAPRESAPGRPAVLLTWQGAVQRLNDLGIHDFRLEPGQDDANFQFVCMYSPPDKPGFTYRFESEASDPLQAVADVLQQIDQRLARR